MVQSSKVKTPFLSPVEVHEESAPGPPPYRGPRSDPYRDGGTIGRDRDRLPRIFDRDDGLGGGRGFLRWHHSVAWRTPICSPSRRYRSGPMPTMGLLSGMPPVDP